MRELFHIRLGSERYGSVLDLQQRLRRLRIKGGVPDLILSVEHDPVITLGRQGGEEHILASRRVLERLQVEVQKVERGGDVTYHGPGQLVVYPILDLRGWGRDLRRYVANLEEVMLRTARHFGVEAHRKPEFPGIWIGLQKLGFVGVHVRRWGTMHGMALNVDLSPNLFSLIVPCGLHGVDAISLADVCDSPVDVHEAETAALRELAEVFDVKVSTVGREELARWVR
ncbi:MAG: lipoyl(octanoyl) transferase LipB [Candidatus Bipolaricaulota bacterium]